MKLLYLSYWNLSDPLTVSTVAPSLKILQTFEFVEAITFVNVERLDSNPRFITGIDKGKIKYQPIFSRNYRPGIFNKVLDFILFPRFLRRIARTEQSEFVIARGAPAGALAYLLWRKTGIPFMVESFEPHSDYMIESGVWSRFDLRFIFQRRWENKQKRFSRALLPVTVNYQNALISEGVDRNRIRVVPCTVDQIDFQYCQQLRKTVRDRFRISRKTIVGIYAGKFGSLYLDDDAFRIYRIFFDEVQDFFLFILSPSEYHGWIREKIRDHRLPESRIHVGYVSHSEVQSFCCASDFGFVTIKSYPSNAYCSPVKTGEYWACGLPVLLTRGVGDESSLIANGIGGVLFDPQRINHSELRAVVDKVRQQISSPDSRKLNMEMVQTLRSPDKLRLAYLYFLKDK